MLNQEKILKLIEILKCPVWYLYQTSDNKDCLLANYPNSDINESLSKNESPDLNESLEHLKTMLELLSKETDTTFLINIKNRKNSNLYFTYTFQIENINSNPTEKVLQIKHFTDIKTFKDACDCLNISPSSVENNSDTPDELAYKKLKIIVKAINQGWEPNWENTGQYKWHPWFNVSSGFAFSGSTYCYTITATTVGSRLCFESEEKSDYTATQFLDLYNQFIL